MKKVKSIEFFKILLKNAFGLKWNLAGLVIFFGIGIVLEIVSRGRFWLGPYFYTLAGLFLLQIIMNYNVAGFMLAAPMRRKLQIGFPITILVVSNAVSMAVILVFRAIWCFHNPDVWGKQSVYFLGCCGILLMSTVYSCGCYKYFIPSFVMLFLLCGSGGFLNGLGEGGAFEWIPYLIRHLSLSFPAMIGIGIAVVVLSGVLCFIITLASYRKPVNIKAYGVRMRNAME